MGIAYDDSGAVIPAGTSADELRAALAVALEFDPPSRWVIGDLLVSLRGQYGQDAMMDAVPDEPKRARLAMLCLTVSERWPVPMRDDALEWGHYRRVRWLDDAGAADALTRASDGGWTPAQLGRWLAGFDPNEPGVADMLRALSAADESGEVTLHATPGGWRLPRMPQAGEHESYTAAIRAAYRTYIGTKADANAA